MRLYILALDCMAIAVEIKNQLPGFLGLFKPDPFKNQSLLYISFWLQLLPVS